MAKEEVKDWITVNGKHVPIYEGESKQDVVNRVIANDNEDIKQKQIARNKAEADKLNKKDADKKQEKLEDRLKGDDLEDAKDFIAELKANDATVDDAGYVTLYHFTTDSAANSIKSSGIMKAKEDGIFFTTKRSSDAQAGGRGNAVLTFKIPVEKLQIDDEFGDEVHVRIPLSSRNSTLNVSKYLIK